MADLEQWLLERFEEAFDTTVALRFTDEGRRRRDAQETDLVLEVVAHELGAVTMSELESLGGTGLEALSGHFKTGQRWSPQNRPMGWPGTV